MLLAGPACATGQVFPTTVWAGPLSLNGTVVLGSKTGQIIGVNIDTGDQRWSIVTQPGRAKIQAVYGTPATDGVLVYAGGFGGEIYALDPAAAGGVQTVWSYTADSPVVGGPAVADGLVLIGSESGKLYAIEAGGDRMGETRWVFQADGRIWSTPAVVNGLAYVTTLNGAVHAVHLTDDSLAGVTAGTEKWRFDAQAGIGASPVEANGIVYVGSFDKNLYALDAVTGQPRWQAPFQGKNWFWATPLVHMDRVYAPSLDHHLYILNAHTGEPVQQAVKTGGAIRGTPALIENRVVIANEEGETWWIEVQSGEARAGGALGSPVYAPLVTVNGRVYIYAQDGALYSVAPQARQPSRLYPLR